MLYLWISREHLSSWSEYILLFGSEETLPSPTWVNEILTAGIDFLEVKQEIVVFKGFKPISHHLHSLLGGTGQQQLGVNTRFGVR